MSLYATLWKLNLPRYGDYLRGCDGITVTMIKRHQPFVGAICSSLYSEGTLWYLGSGQVW